MGLLDAVGGMVGGAAGLIGGGIREATGSGKSSYKQSDFSDTNKYDPNSFNYGGSTDAYNQERNRLGGLAQSYDQRGAIAPDWGNANQSRDAQLGAIGMYRDAANGIGPSVAERSMAAGNASALRQASAIQAGARGAGAMGAAQSAAANQAANLQSSNIANTGLLRAQEIANARQGLLQGTSGLHGQDIGQAFQGAQIGLAGRAQNDAQNRYYAGLQQAMQQEQFNAQMARQKFLAGTHETADAANQRNEQMNAGVQGNNFNGMMGGVQGMATGAFGMANGGGGGGNNEGFNAGYAQGSGEFNDDYASANTRG